MINLLWVAQKNALRKQSATAADADAVKLPIAGAPQNGRF